MREVFTRFIYCVFLLGAFGCARKEIYLLSNAGNSENAYVKKNTQTLPVQQQLSAPILPEAPVAQPEPVVYTASAQAHLVPKAAIFPTKILPADFRTVQPNIQSVTKLVKQQVKLIKAE